ncbi:transcription elongation factor spt5 [Malassezia yamatoensis]|uniref:Transcription elongation factor SPT5 n=1 Tax=Malassezia yamatoensis TaxID=253288 RepID=A0AAJ6CI17_9BASI|nr:transcription elongation factor spt5 [Malassezia yamatoensis]
MDQDPSHDEALYDTREKHENSQDQMIKTETDQETQSAREFQQGNDLDAADASDVQGASVSETRPGDGQQGNNQDDHQKEHNEDNHDDAQGVDEEDEDEVDDEDDENDDDEEDDEEDEEEDEEHRLKRQRRNRFLDVEAEVDNDDEEVDDEEAEELMREDGFIADDIAEDSREAQLKTAADNQRLDRFRRQEEELSAEALAEELRQRHARNSRYSSQSDYAEVPQRLLMPSVDDPGLWRIKCKRGRERHLVATVMRRALSLEAEGKPLRIFSVFCRDSLEGQLFVEARRSEDVNLAFQGLAGAYIINSKPFLVPILEMADLLKLQKKKTNVPVGGWVRLKRGKYAGDLAQVLDMAENGEEVGVKLVPRIDLNPDENDSYTDRAGRKRKKPINSTLTALGFRPPQRLFNPEEVQRAYPHDTPSKRGGVWVFGGDTYRDGYLEKDFKLTALSVDDVNPSLDEVLHFTGESHSETGTESNNVDLALLADASKRGLEATLQPGDHVEVFEGEQAGVAGTIDSLDGDVVVIDLAHDTLAGQRVEVPAKSVRKSFRAGDHVKVLAGKHADETGLVVKVEEGVTTFLSDLSLKEVSVFSKDIREAAEVGSGVNVIGNYELHNLVQLDPQTAGVIFKIERESFKVLDQNNQVVSVHPHQISMRRDTTRSIALDHNGHEIHIGDMVKEIESPLSQFRQGQVLHIYQSTLLFLSNRSYRENGGVFLARARQVEPLAPTNVKAQSTDLSKLNPAMANPGAEGGANAVAPRRGGRDVFAGRHVAIVRGPYKTYRGIIKDTTGDMARVELHTMSKILTVPLDAMVEKNPVTGESRRLIQPSGPGAMGPPPNAAGNPYASGAMPMGGRTPAYNPYDGARTPAYGAGARTPAYGGGYGQTPNPYSATPNPYANPGGRTPAYPGQTPNPYANPGGRTPAYSGQTPNPYSTGMNGGRTPALGYGATPNPYVGATPNPYVGATPNPYVGATPNPYGGGYTGATPNPYDTHTANPWSAAATGHTAAPPPPARAVPLVEGIRVRISANPSGPSYQRGAYNDQFGELTARNPVACQVRLENGTHLTDVPTACLIPVRPSRAGDQCRITDGAYKGSRVTFHSQHNDIAQCSMGDGQQHELPMDLLALSA